jgi:hypothetical protein
LMINFGASDVKRVCKASPVMFHTSTELICELSSWTFCNFRRELSSLRRDGLTSPDGPQASSSP